MINLSTSLRKPRSNEVKFDRCNDGIKKEAQRSVLYVYLDGFGESSAEHQSLSFARRAHLVISDNSADVLLESHVQHSVGLIKNQIFHLPTVWLSRSRSHQLILSVNFFSLFLRLHSLS